MHAADNNYTMAYMFTEFRGYPVAARMLGKSSPMALSKAA